MPKPPTELPDHQVTPNPKLERRTHRQFSTESGVAEQKRIEALERENVRLQPKLSTAEDCLSLQKKPYRCSIA